MLYLHRRPQVCWGSLPALQPLVCFSPALLLKDRQTPQVCIAVSKATSDHHGCLYLQIVVTRQGHGQAMVGPQAQHSEPRPAQSGANKYSVTSQQDGCGPRGPGCGSGVTWLLCTLVLSYVQG